MRAAEIRVKPKIYKYLLVTPVIVIFTIFTLYPFIYALYLSFTDAKIQTFRNPALLGLENYHYLLISPGYIWKTLQITATFTIIVVTLETLIGLGLAILVFSTGKVVKTLNTIFLLPMCVTPLFMGALGRLTLHSIVGVIPYYFRMLSLPIPNLSDPIHAITIIALLDVWQWTPFMYVILLAGLQSIPQEIYEAAKMDGASRINVFRRITLPLLKRYLLVAIIIRSIDAVKVFDIPYILTTGGPGSPVGATSLISVFLYLFMFQYNRIGVTAAASILLLVIVSLFTSRFVKYFIK